MRMAIKEVGNLRETKKDMFIIVDRNMGMWDRQHKAILHKASATAEGVLSFYKEILRSVTDCEDEDIIPYDGETGIIQGYQVNTDCPYQQQNFVRVDCTGINIDVSGSKRAWGVMVACEVLRTMAKGRDG